MLKTKGRNLDDLDGCISGNRKADGAILRYQSRIIHKPKHAGEKASAMTLAKRESNLGAWGSDQGS